MMERKVEGKTGPKQNDTFSTESFPKIKLSSKSTSSAKMIVGLALCRVPTSLTHERSCSQRQAHCSEFRQHYLRFFLFAFGFSSCLPLFLSRLTQQRRQFRDSQLQKIIKGARLSMLGRRALPRTMPRPPSSPRPTSPPGSVNTKPPPPPSPLTGTGRNPYPPPHLLLSFSKVCKLI